MHQFVIKNFDTLVSLHSQLQPAAPSNACLPHDAREPHRAYPCLTPSESTDGQNDANTSDISATAKIQSGPKKCIHSLLINIFGINLNEISISGWECNIMFSQQMAQALLAGADVLKCIQIEISFKFIPKILMSKECIHFFGPLCIRFTSSFLRVCDFDSESDGGNKFPRKVGCSPPEQTVS